MPASLVLLFNHQFTADQEEDARKNLGISNFLHLPPELREMWGNAPPDLPGLHDYLEPVRQWLTGHAVPGDYVLIQGDFGATYLMVTFTLEKGFVPVYATTQREAAEEILPDGSVKLTHRFRHTRFRKYGA